jgi:glycosyltransferase involved in cell wall biosynthesis
MVGPDPNGLGGISKVIKIWKDNRFFSDFKIKYIASTSVNTGNNYLYFLEKLCEFVFLLFKECNLVYIHTSSGNSFYRKSFFLLMGIIFRKKIILHIHPAHFYNFIRKTNNLLKRYILFILNNTFAFIVLTDGIKKKIFKKFPDKKIYVLANSIDIKKMDNHKEYERGKRQLLYLGWFIKQKGVYDLVDAIEILVKKGENIHLNFYGCKEVANLKNYTYRKGLTNEIHVHSWISNDEVIKVLYQHTLLILPTYSEGIPNVILEAMATKTPIIATSVGGLKDVLIDEKNAIIAKVGNPIHLSKQIDRCLNDHKLCHEISSNAYDHARTSFDVNIIRQKFKNIIYLLKTQDQ